jgi:hypothetical protein
MGQLQLYMEFRCTWSRTRIKNWGPNVGTLHPCTQPSDVRVRPVDFHIVATEIFQNYQYMHALRLSHKLGIQDDDLKLAPHLIRSNDDARL